MDNKLVVNHNGGFFSCCTIRMILIIRFLNENKIFPIVDSSNQWSFYKDQPGDITQLFFNNIGDDELTVMIAFAEVAPVLPAAAPDEPPVKVM